MTGKHRRRARQRRILIVDAAAESREAAIAQLVDEGYELIATGSVDAACALVWAGQPELVLINLSVFSVESLDQLGRALSLRSRIRVVGIVSQFTTDAPPATWVVRLPRGEALTFGFEFSHPN